MKSHTPRARSISELQEALGPEFRVVRVLGEGRTACVYQAHELELGRLVAIKVPHQGSTAADSAARKFEREARALARLEHPHVARAYRVLHLADGAPCLVMGLIRGRTIEDRLASEGRLQPEFALPILKNIGSALAAAHASAIVHRDVRPGNILWDDAKEIALLIDFGVATLVSSDGDETSRISSTGNRIDVSRYLAPEIFLDEDETWAVDMYALGVTAYELLTGEGPFGDPPFRTLLKATLHGTPRNLADLAPELDHNVAKAIRSCLNRNPNQRPGAGDFVRALEGRWQMEPEPSRKTIIERWIEAPPRILGSGFVGAGFVLGGAATLNEQYPGLLPPWAFTVALASGAAIILAAAVLEWSGGADRPSKTVVRSLLTAVGAAWAVTSLVILKLMS